MSTAPSASALITSPTSAQPSGFGLMLTPATIDAAKDLAKTLANSGLVPAAYAGKPDMILIAGAMGHRLGLDIFSAMAGIAVINNRPTLWGDAMLGICQNRTDWGGMQVVRDDATGSCVVTITRKGHPSPYVGSFSMEEAQRAGLAEKAGPWKQYPQRMIELRARSYALRSAYADALSGFHSREEMEDVEPREVEHSVLPEIKAAKERGVPADAQTKQEAPAKVEEKAPAQESIASAEREPALPTIAEVEKAAKQLHADFATAALPDLREIASKMGAAKIGEIKPDMAGDAMELLAQARGRLQASKDLRAQS